METLEESEKEGGGRGGGRKFTGILESQTEKTYCCAPHVMVQVHAKRQQSPAVEGDGRELQQEQAHDGAVSENGHEAEQQEAGVDEAGGPHTQHDGGGNKGLEASPTAGGAAEDAELVAQELGLQRPVFKGQRRHGYPGGAPGGWRGPFRLGPFRWTFLGVGTVAHGTPAQTT